MKSTSRPWKLRVLKRSIRIISVETGAEVCSIALSAYTDNQRHFEDAGLIVRAVNASPQKEDFKP